MLIIKDHNMPEVLVSGVEIIFGSSCPCIRWQLHCCVFPWQSFKTQSTLYKMHCTLFGEDNSKQDRQFL